MRLPLIRGDSRHIVVASAYQHNVNITSTDRAQTAHLALVALTPPPAGVEELVDAIRNLTWAHLRLDTSWYFFLLEGLPGLPEGYVHNTVKGVLDALRFARPVVIAADQAIRKMESDPAYEALRASPAWTAAQYRLMQVAMLWRWMWVVFGGEGKVDVIRRDPPCAILHFPAEDELDFEAWLDRLPRAMEMVRCYTASLADDEGFPFLTLSQIAAARAEIEAEIAEDARRR